MAAKLLKVIKAHWPLVVILIIGAILRWINLAQFMSFFYDQARDALVARGILHGHLVLVGPSADTSGLFMGPLWYYFLTPLYFISQGNPAVVLWLVSFFDLATIVFLYLLGKRLFDKKTGLIAAAIWSTGAFPVSYARILSNPSTTALWSILLFFSLEKIQQGKEKYLILTSIFLAMLYQLNPASAYFLTPFTFLALVFLKKYLKSKKIIILSLAVFLLSFFPQFAFEVRNHFPSLVHLRNLYLTGGPKEGFLHGLWLRWENWRDELSGYTFFLHREWSVFSFILGLLFFLVSKSKNKQLFGLWIVVPLLTYFFLYFRGESHPHYLLAWIPTAVILFAYLITRLKLIFWPVSAVILLLFLWTTSIGLQKGIFLKSPIAQPGNPNSIGLADQIRVIDYIYSDAQGQPFGYHNYGIVPYWEDKEWQYLFLWRGKGKYGYLPSRRAGNPLYLIYEPDPYLTELQRHWLKDFRSLDKGPVVAKTKISVYTIEKFDKRAL